MSGTNYQITITVVGQDKASGPLKGISGVLGGIGSIAGGILGANLLANIAGGIMDMGREALDSYAKFERLGSSLQSLSARELLNTGQATNMKDAMAQSAGASQELLSWISKLAVQSPFNQDDISSAFRLSMAYGFTTKEAQALTTTMVDFAAGSGASGDVMNRIALALGQIKAKGKLAGQEVMQLTEAGLPVRDILAKAFGVTTAELEKMQSDGLIPADKAIKAITESLNKDFGGAAKAQSQTFSGLISSLEDIKSIGLREFMTGTFQAVQPYVAAFVDKLSSPEFMATLHNIGLHIGIFVSALLETGPQLIAAIQGMAGGFDSLEKQVKPFADLFQNYLNKGLDNFAKFWEQNGPTIQGIANQVFTKITQFLGYLAAEILPMVMWWFVELSKWFVDNGPMISKYLQQQADSFGLLLIAVQTVWVAIKPILNGLFAIILDLAKLYLQVVTGDWAGAWATLGDIVNVAWESVKASFLDLANFVTSWFGTSWQAVVDQWASNWEQLKQIVAKAWQMTIDWLTSKRDEIRNNLVNAWEAAKNAVTGKVEEIRSGIAAKWAEILLNLSQAWQNIKDGIANKIEEIRSGIISKWEEIKTGLANKIQEIKDGIHSQLILMFAGMGLDFDVFGARWTKIWEDLKLIAVTLWNRLVETVKANIAGLILGIMGPIALVALWLATQWQTIQTNAANTWAAIQAKLGEFAGMLAAKWTEISGQVTTTWNNIMTTVKTQVDAIMLPISKFGNDVYTVFDTIKTETMNKISEAWSGIVTSTTTQVGNAMLTISKFGNDVYTVFDTMREQAIAKAGELWTGVVDKFNELKTSIENKASEFASIGSKVIGSILQGMKDNAGQLLSYLTDVVQDVIDGILGNLGIGGTGANDVGPGNAGTNNFNNALAGGMGSSFSNALAGSGGAGGGTANDNSSQYYAPVTNVYPVQQNRINTLRASVVRP